MDVLVVCRANVCRSRATEALLRDALAHLGVAVTSAGTDAALDAGPCPEAAVYLRARELTVAGRPGQQLTAELVAGSDLVLAVDDAAASEVVRVAPAARRRVLRLVWAAAATSYVAGYVAADEVPPGAPALQPGWDAEARWAWLASELDAARGQLPAPARLGGDRFYDVDDPHEGLVTHGDALDRIAAACAQLGSAATVVVRPGLYAAAG